MKPEQFIREFGVKKAREALTLCCWMDGSFCTRLWHGCVQNNHECCVDVKDLKRLVESVDRVNALDGGIEEAKAIFDKAPIDSDAYSPITKTYFYSPNIRYDFEWREWVDMDRGVDLDLYQEFIFIAELDQWIEDHESIYGGGDDLKG